MSKTIIFWVSMVLLLWNIVVFATYGMDKSFAEQEKRRIPEKTLISMAFGMGAPGAIGGMLVFRHKIRKPAFVLWISLALAVNATLGYGAYRLWRAYF